MICKNDLFHMNKQSGVGLLELMIALVVFTMGVTAVFKFQSRYFYYYDIAKQRSEALVIAKNKIEALRTFEVLATTAGKVAYADIVSGTASTAGNNATYTSTWTVTTNVNPNYKSVNNVVSWTDRRNTTQSVTLSSIIGGIDPATSGLIYN
jgi:Tfp pilus assembly protein PilV